MVGSDWERRSSLIVEIKCEEVVRGVSNYLDDEVDVELRRRVEAHFQQCSRCFAVLDGTRNIVRLVGDDRAFDVPAGFGRRLASKLQKSLQCCQ